MNDDVAFSRLRNEAQMPVADVSALTLEEIFIAVACEHPGAMTGTQQS
jgi:hypothetical protein